MVNKSNISFQKERKRVKMRKRMLNLILLVIIFQLITSAAVLIFGGEFRELREYSYQTIVEKTKNRGTYIQNEFQKRAVFVQEYAKQIDNVAAGILKDRGASIDDLQTDRELSGSIIRSSVGLVSELLRSAMVNDAYLILDSGSLYAGEGSDTALAALYLQSEDANLNLDSSDVQMVFGSSSISQEYGFTCQSDWTEYFMPDTEENSTFDFYYRPLRAAQENSGLTPADLGYWSRFSRIIPSARTSMKYSVPLIAGDGTVYGVVGIGVRKKTVLADLPFYDFLGGSACYVLGYDSSDGNYDVLAGYGSAYDSLLGGASTLHVMNREDEEVYRFERVTDVELLGSVQYMELYGANSPYMENQWSLISVSDRSSVLWQLLFLQRMLAVSAMLSLIVAVIVAFLGSSRIVKPLSDLSRRIRTKRKQNEVVHFQPSNIYEIDEITDAITQLQINVQGFSSQVSKMISIADVGLGSFMYDRADDSVFVGQSLIKVLKLDLPQDKDIVMSRQEFLNSIKNPEIRTPIAAGLDLIGGKIREDVSEVYQINEPDGSTFWYRLGYSYAPNSSIGIVQDITEAMIERNRIEHERDYDILTGLMNRHAYYRNMEKLFHDRSKLNITAFVMIDLDNLKYVNDTYGHDFGDDYIKTAASALKKFKDYGGIVARISGDEFNICLPGFSSKETVRQIVAAVRTELLQSKCLLADGTHFAISASMGVSWYPDDADSYELLMKYADFAMYTIKHSTKGEVAEFDKSSYSTDSVLLTGVEELKRIIDECSVKYAFQSVVSAKTGEIYGYEALMRVQSNIFQSPLELLRTAKTGAKLYEIERLTWTKSLADFQALVDAGRIEKTSHVFINSIANNKLGSEVEALIEEKYPHLLDHIVLEILEGESADEDCTALKAQFMQKWGGQMALDDFGTGYNSEYALLNLRPNIIKIDRSIISGCDKDDDRRMIIENLVKVAHAKNILVLAEGVETEAEMRTVIACGLDYMQGYYLARPVFEPEPLAPEIADAIRRFANMNNTPKDGD